MLCSVYYTNDAHSTAVSSEISAHLCHHPEEDVCWSKPGWGSQLLAPGAAGDASRQGEGIPTGWHGSPSTPSSKSLQCNTESFASFPLRRNAGSFCFLRSKPRAEHWWWEPRAGAFQQLHAWSRARSCGDCSMASGPASQTRMACGETRGKGQTSQGQDLLLLFLHQDALFAVKISPRWPVHFFLLTTGWSVENKCLWGAGKALHRNHLLEFSSCKLNCVLQTRSL